MTRVLIDACVLYPSILRSILLDCAKAGLFEPLWSERIVEEWRRAADRNGVLGEASLEIAMFTADWRSGLVEVPQDIEAELTLPDVNDRHVLAAAIAAQADELLTANISDFPTRVLGRFNVVRRHPDDFLLELALNHGAIVSKAIDRVHGVAEGRAEAAVNRRKMLQKSGVPRVAKWDAAQAR